MSDIDGDGTQDLVGVVQNSGNGFYEVHGFSGATGFQQSNMDVSTPLNGTPGSYVFAFADVDRDGKPDLVGIKAYAGFGTVELHVLSGASNYSNFIVHSGTPLPSSSAYVGRFYQMADIDLDGYPDLVALVWNSGAGQLEIHALSAASGYQQYIIETLTPMTNYNAFSNFNFAFGDLDHDGKADLIGIEEYGTGSGKVEVYAVSGSTNFQQFIAATPTAFFAAPNPSNYLFTVGPVSPTVQVTNLTHPELSPNFLVGDVYQYVVFGPPNQSVTASKNGGASEYLGQTDPSGRLVLTYQANVNWVGTYTQIWSVGNQMASPALTFLIGQTGTEGTLTTTTIAATPDSSIVGVSSISIANGSATTYSFTEESYNASLYYDVQTVATLSDNGNVIQQASDYQNGSAGGYLSNAAAEWHEFSLQTDHYVVAYLISGGYFQNPYYFQSGYCDESGDCTYGPGGGVFYITAASIYLGSTLANQVAIAPDGSIPFNDDISNILPGERTPPPGGFGLVVSKWKQALAAAWTITLARQAQDPSVVLPFILQVVGDCQDRHQATSPKGLAERNRYYRVLDGQGRPWPDNRPLLVKENIITWTSGDYVSGGGNWSTAAFTPHADEDVKGGIMLDGLRASLDTLSGTPPKGALQQFYALGFPSAGFPYPSIPGYSDNTVPLLVLDTLSPSKGLFGTLSNLYTQPYIEINNDGGMAPNVRLTTDSGVFVPRYTCGSP